MPLKRESFTNGLSHLNFPWEATKLMKGYTKLIGGVKAKQRAPRDDLTDCRGARVAPLTA